MHILAAVAAVLLGGLALFQPAVDLAAERIFTDTNPPPRAYSVRTRRGVEAVMADGVTLRADVHAPAGLEGAPTILIRIPFTDTFWNRLRSDAIARFWAARGYVVVVQGTRGRYHSDGVFVPLLHEREDGLATLHWIREQPWYDGNVGTWGGSAFGQTQWAVADQSDPGAKAMFVQIASSEFYDVMHPGGAVALETALYWALNSHGQRDREVDYVALDRGAAAQATLQADDIAAGVDVAFFNGWVDAPRTDAYWRASDGDNRASTATSPVLLLGGWYDPFLPEMLEDFALLRANPASAESRLIIGPYTHAADLNWPGSEINQSYRTASVAPALEWFGHYLRGEPLTMPRVRLFVMGENAWRDENEWPLARTRYTPFFLSDGGVLSDTAPEGDDGADQFAYVRRSRALEARCWARAEALRCRQPLARGPTC